MSIALENNRNRIEGSGFINGMSCISIFDSSETERSMDGILTGSVQFLTDNLTTAATKVGEREEEEELDTCSSSSIGNNSDLSEMSDGEGSGEVQSSYKGPLDTMDALEEVLPVRRGISRFYHGKSKSFTSLADASSSSSIKEIAKPENSYSKKRKNLLAFNNIYEKNRNFPLRSNGGGISKRPTTNFNRSTLALAVAMSRSSSSESNNTSENSNSTSPSPSPSPSPTRHLLPPLHPRSSLSPWRSFSLTDLQCVPTNLSSNNREKHKKLH